MLLIASNTVKTLPSAPALDALERKRVVKKVRRRASVAEAVEMEMKFLQSEAAALLLDDSADAVLPKREKTRRAQVPADVHSQHLVQQTTRPISNE